MIRPARRAGIKLRRNDGWIFVLFSGARAAITSSPCEFCPGSSLQVLCTWVIILG
jgi:hypothetical protein